MKASDQRSTFKPKNILYRHLPCARTNYDGYREGFTEKNYIHKYSPKYYKKLAVDASDPLTISKLKRMKRIHHFKGYFRPNQSKYLFFLIFCNKRQDVKTLPITYYIEKWSRSPPRFLSFNMNHQKLKLCSEVQSISLPEPIFPVIRDFNYRDYSSCSISPNKITNYFKGKPAIKNLQFVFDEVVKNDILSFIAKLKNQKQYLNTLEMLKLYFSKDEDRVFTKIFQDNSFCQYITHLIFDYNSGLNLLKQPTILANFCQNLKLLSFPFANVPQQVFHLLKSLQNLDRLESFKCTEIIISPLLLENLRLPPSLRTLWLGFQNIEWNNLFPEGLDWTFIHYPDRPNPFEQSGLFMKFCKQFEQLGNLNRIIIDVDNLRHPLYIKHFFNVLLKKLPRPNSLEYRLPYDIYEYKWRSSRADSQNFVIYLPFTPELTTHLRPSLKDLTLSMNQFDYILELDVLFLEKLFNLAIARIYGWFSVEPLAKSLDLFAQRLETQKRRKLTLKISTVVIGSQQALHTLLHHLRRIRNNERLEVSIEIYLECNDGILYLSILREFLKSNLSPRALYLEIVLREGLCEDTIADVFESCTNVTEFKVSHCTTSGMKSFIFQKGKVIRCYNHDRFYLR